MIKTLKINWYCSHYRIPIENILYIRQYSYEGDSAYVNSRGKMFYAIAIYLKTKKDPLRLSSSNIDVVKNIIYEYEKLLGDKL
jgi:hypothetical protein